MNCPRCDIPMHSEMIAEATVERCAKCCARWFRSRVLISIAVLVVGGVAVTKCEIGSRAFGSVIFGLSMAFSMVWFSEALGELRGISGGGFSQRVEGPVPSVVWAAIGWLMIGVVAFACLMEMS
jgi:hypothetical protein